MVGVLVVAAINARQVVLRLPWVYAVGAVMFAVGGSLAAAYHRGAVADRWAIVGFVGFALTALGVVGLPPRAPERRLRR